jgi:hypothetical protein
MKGRMLA